MIISVLHGGLGNQLFQYAAGRALADRRRAPLFLDGSEYFYSDHRQGDLWKFRVRARPLPLPVSQALDGSPAGNAAKAAVKSVARRLVGSLDDMEKGYDPRVAALPWFSRLDGFWQTERYFASDRARLLADLSPREPLPPALARWLERAADGETVAVHVRRGDLVNDDRYIHSVGTLSPEYYEAALSRLRARLGGNARACVFSDDPAWCEQHLPRVLPLEIVSGAATRSAFEDFVAMSRCRHFVIANSTFSWWAAWLGTHPEKQVVAPASFHREPRPWEGDLLPGGWERAEPFFEPIPGAEAAAGRVPS